MAEGTPPSAMLFCEAGSHAYATLFPFSLWPLKAPYSIISTLCCHDLD